MTVLRLIEDECCNWQEEHKCLGVSMFDNIPFGNGECCIILHQKPCTHFENCVLPLAKYKNTERKIIDEYCLSNPVSWGYSAQVAA